MKALYIVLILALVASCGRPPASSQQSVTTDRLQDGERFYTVNGLRHWVKIKGSQHGTTPIVVVHGGPGGNNYTFERTAGPRLEEFSTVIYYEQRGSGRSEAPLNKSDYQLPTLLSDLDVLRDSLGLEKMHLLGYSFGAELSLRYALQHPNRVEKLILSSPAELSNSNMLVQIQGFHAIGDSSTKAKIEGILRDTTALADKYNHVWNLASSDLVDRFLFLNPDHARKNRALWQESKLTNTGLMAKVYLQHNKGDLIQKATGLPTPTLLISGAHDKNGGLHTGLSLKQVLPNSAIRLYENSAHFPDIEEPERFTEDVKSFVLTK
ncbi:alpha/beta fold hydrolase [Pontibacter roseus]|uniref:alpha/beta fold hydrolase n=1 Tax=Pontibacter roseus TaxID=336989 RepID=UPI00037D7732|nr:alpha/beta hydrolase [Pontibacter roseus]